MSLITTAKLHKDEAASRFTHLFIASVFCSAPAMLRTDALNLSPLFALLLLFSVYTHGVGTREKGLGLPICMLWTEVSGHGVVMGD